VKTVSNSLVWACILVPLLTACATYRYGGEKFSTAEAALAKQSEHLAKIISDVEPTSSPVHGKALVALPDKVELRRHYVRATKEAGQPQIDYILAAVEADHDMMVKVIEKRALFDQVTLVRDDDPPNTTIGDNDFLIFRDIDGWFFKSKRTAPKRIPFDAGVAAGRARMHAFLDTLGDYARETKK
jgi:hypothetical protein